MREPDISTGDLAYRAVAPDDFASMLSVDRHAARSTAFDRITAATHDHFWNPLDPKYIDFSIPFDLERQPLVPESLIPGLALPYVSDSLSNPALRTRFINESVRWMFSSILHGEQGALNLSASLCHVFVDPGAQEYAANQAREEARHVTAFARYIQVRWGSPVACSPSLQSVLEETVSSPHVYKKIVGMQLLVEGLAMGAFATMYKALADPLGRRLLQLVMADEAFHHKFGKVWADRTLPRLTPREHIIVECWAAHCFQKLLFNFVAPQEQRELYLAFGMDPERVIEESNAMTSASTLRETMLESTNVFRVLVKTLLKGGIITRRTRSVYAAFVDLDGLDAEEDNVAGEDIALDGLRDLQAINILERPDFLTAVGAQLEEQASSHEARHQVV